MYPKDTEKWKQFTTIMNKFLILQMLFCIPKILKNESNSQRFLCFSYFNARCFVSQRYWKMKAIHNSLCNDDEDFLVVLYPKDTEKWKQFTTKICKALIEPPLFCIPKILKNESNSQRWFWLQYQWKGCFVSQRYWKMKSSKGKARRFGVAKAIHNAGAISLSGFTIVLYPKDTEKWKQFTTLTD